MNDFSPREIVSELDRFIVGQKNAKRAVAIALRNGFAICLSIFACQRARLVPATLNPDYTAPELAPMLEDADPALVIAHAELADRFPGRRFLGV